MVDLKPCPFCGGEASHVSGGKNRSPGWYKVFCTRCQCRTVEWPSLKYAADAWNRRVEQSQPMPEGDASEDIKPGGYRTEIESAKRSVSKWPNWMKRAKPKPGGDE